MGLKASLTLTESVLSLMGPGTMMVKMTAQTIVLMMILMEPVRTLID
jgi:hypothetical protein